MYNTTDNNINNTATSTNHQDSLSTIRMRAMEKYSATTSYCCHTGIKLVIGTEFQNSFLKGKFIKHEHWIFSLDTPRLLRLLGTHLHSKIDSERYLVLVAVLIKLKVVNTERSPLFLDTPQLTALEKPFLKLLKAWHALVKQGIGLPPKLPTIMIDPDSCDNVVMLKEAIKNTTGVLTDYLWQHGMGAKAEERDLEKTCYSQLNSEKEFKKAMQNYSTKATSIKYSNAVADWVIRYLKAEHTDTSDDTLKSLNYYFKVEATRLDDKVLKAHITLLKEILPFCDEFRLKSNAAIRHLTAKLEDVYTSLKNYGFLLVEEEEVTVGNTGKYKGQGVTYTTKTKITEAEGLKVVPPAMRSTGGKTTAIARMMAKFGKTL